MPANALGLGQVNPWLLFRDCVWQGNIAVPSCVLIHLCQENMNVLRALNYMDQLKIFRTFFEVFVVFAQELCKSAFAVCAVSAVFCLCGLCCFQYSFFPDWWLHSLSHCNLLQLVYVSVLAQSKRPETRRRGWMKFKKSKNQVRNWKLKWKSSLFIQTWDSVSAKILISKCPKNPKWLQKAPRVPLALVDLVPSFTCQLM